MKYEHVSEEQMKNVPLKKRGYFSHPKLSPTSSDFPSTNTSPTATNTTTPIANTRCNIKEEEKLSALNTSQSNILCLSSTIDALSLNQPASATTSPSNESTITNLSSSTCHSSSPEDSGSKKTETITTTTTLSDSPSKSSKKKRQFINRGTSKKKEENNDSESGESGDDSDDSGSSDEDETLYCKCNRPASYGWMIACDHCDK